MNNNKYMQFHCYDMSICIIHKVNAVVNCLQNYVDRLILLWAMSFEVAVVGNIELKVFVQMNEMYLVAVDSFVLMVHTYIENHVQDLVGIL